MRVSRVGRGLLCEHPRHGRVQGSLGPGAWRSGVSWSLDPKLVAARLNAALPMPDGLRWQAPASATLALFPRPILDMYEVKLIIAAGEAIMTAPAAAIALSPPQLLVGQLSISDARLRQPNLEIDLDALAKQVEEAGASPASPMRRVRFNDARIRVLAGAFISTRPWQGSTPSSPGRRSRSRCISGAGDWRGRALSTEMRLDAPVALAAGGASGASVKLSTQGLDVAFEGTWTTGGKPSLSGQLTASLDSMRATAAAIQYAEAASLPLYGAAFSGAFAAGPDALSFGDATLTLAGQPLEGSGNFARSPTGWTAAATFASGAWI